MHAIFAYRRGSTIFEKRNKKGCNSLFLVKSVHGSVMDIASRDECEVLSLPKVIGLNKVLDRILCS